MKLLHAEVHFLILAHCSSSALTTYLLYDERLEAINNPRQAITNIQ
jgi:hypothetical protein